MKYLIFTINIFFSVLSFAQNKHDNIWWYSMWGGNVNYPDQSYFLNMSQFPPAITKSPKYVPGDSFNISMADSIGNLLFYSNGLAFYNKNNEIMENGDSINPGWWAKNGYESKSGYAGFMSSMAFPIADKTYDALYMHHDFCNIHNNLYFSRISFKDNPLGKVIIRDLPIKEGCLSFDMMSMVRHANGRDWWHILPYNKGNGYFTCLATPLGITDTFTQNISPILNDPTLPESGSQNQFTPDGKKYIDFDGYKCVFVYDFDRCTGLLSNPIHFKTVDGFGGTGAAISQNSQFLYVQNAKISPLEFSLFQYDLTAADIASTATLVAADDFFQDTFQFGPPIETRMDLMRLFPDGRIYGINWGASPTRYIGYINHPNIKGIDCEVVQHGIKLPIGITQMIPNYINYNLFDESGTLCDSLGIDTPPPVSTAEPAPLKTTLLLSPNPVRTECWVHLSDKMIPAESTISVFNQLGQVVFVQKTSQSMAEMRISTGNLLSGVYFLSIQMPGYSTTTRRFVKIAE